MGRLDNDVAVYASAAGDLTRYRNPIIEASLYSRRHDNVV
jgi:hypothetical protein